MNQPGLYQDLIAGLLGPDGEAPQDWRRAAFDNIGPENDRIRELVGKVATAPTGVTDLDFRHAAEVGLSDDQIWELVICAAVGQAARGYENAIHALAGIIEEGGQ